MNKRQSLVFAVSLALRGVAGRRAGRRPYWALPADEAREHAEAVVAHLEAQGWRIDHPKIGATAAGAGAPRAPSALQD